MYSSIIDPITKKSLSIYSQKGRRLLSKYLQNGGGKFECHKFSKSDKEWQKQGGKTGRKYTRTQQEMCERHGFIFTKGKNESYDGCGTCWCCKEVDQIKESSVTKEESPVIKTINTAMREP